MFKLTRTDLDSVNICTALSKLSILKENTTLKLKVNKRLEAARVKCYGEEHEDEEYGRPIPFVRWQIFKICKSGTV